jgi:PAS domain S-box-containing protein
MLSDGEELFRGIFEASVIGLAVVELDGHFRRMNQSFCELLGYDEAELIGRKLQEITHPDDLSANALPQARLLRGEISTFTSETRYIHKLGHVVWTVLAVSLVRDASRAPVRFVSQSPTSPRAIRRGTHQRVMRRGSSTRTWSSSARTASSTSSRTSRRTICRRRCAREVDDRAAG